MFEPYLFKLNIAVSIGLKSIKALKNFVAEFQQYEYLIKISDIEKHFLIVEEQLGFCKSAIPTLTKGLTPKGTNFYNEIFTYNIFHNWKNVPKNFTVLLKERQVELNKSREFNDNSLNQLVDLNKKLAVEEDHIQLFLKSSKDLSDHVPPGTLTIKCYTQSNYYEFNHRGFNYAVPFYQIEFFLNDFITSTPIFYGKDQPPLDFLTSLPIKFKNEKICLLFALLATDGLLAWADFLNIDRVEIDLDLKYRFTAY